MESRQFATMADSALALYDVLNHPEDVLRELGSEEALVLVKRLSADPEADAVLKECRLMKLIESGVKIVTGKIITGNQEESNDE